jgi:hypothetical protein
MQAMLDNMSPDHAMILFMTAIAITLLLLGYVKGRIDQRRYHIRKHYKQLVKEKRGRTPEVPKRDINDVTV